MPENLDKPGVLRDYLATDRTILANERTLLAYVRTALTMFIAGASFVKFFGSSLFKWGGFVLMPLGLITFALGLWRYEKTRKLVHEVEKKNGFSIKT